MDVARGHDAYVAAEERSWAPRATEVPRSIPPSFHDRGLFTHTAANFGRRVEAEPAAVEEIDVEPQLPPPPRWMLMMGGAAIAALMGALLGGFMHI